MEEQRTQEALEAGKKLKTADAEVQKLEQEVAAAEKTKLAKDKEVEQEVQQEKAAQDDVGEAADELQAGPTADKALAKLQGAEEDAKAKLLRAKANLEATSAAASKAEASL